MELRALMEQTRTIVSVQSASLGKIVNTVRSDLQMSREGRGSGKGEGEEEWEGEEWEGEGEGEGEEEWECEREREGGRRGEVTTEQNPL